MKIPSQEELETLFNEADEQGEFTPRHIAKMVRQIMVTVDAAIDQVQFEIEAYFAAEDAR